MCKGIVGVVIVILVLGSLFSAWNQDEKRNAKCESVGGYPSFGSCLVVENNKIVKTDIKE